MPPFRRGAEKTFSQRNTSEVRYVKHFKTMRATKLIYVAYDNGNKISKKQSRTKIFTEINFRGHLSSHF